MSSYSVRRPTGSRSVSDQIPYAARPDCVRCPIRLRSVSDQIAFGVRSDCVRCPIGLRTQNGRKLYGDELKSLGKTTPNLRQSHQKPRANLQKTPR